MRKREYRYLGYVIDAEGNFTSPFGNKIKWIDDKFIKLNIDGVVRCKNGLNILYEVYNGEKVTRKNIVCYKNALTKAKTKDNLILKPKQGRLYVNRYISDEKAKEIQLEYGLTEEERRLIKNRADHPTISYRELAAKYNVSINTIQRIIQGTYTLVDKKSKVREEIVTV